MSLLKDKRVVYGIAGAAALLVGAFIMYKMGDGEQEEQISIGPLKRDGQGYIDFDQFIQIFEISSAAAKTQFAAKKKVFVQDRRKVMTDKEAYQKIVMQMTQEEEQIINTKLQSILEKLQIDEQEF